MKPITRRREPAQRFSIASDPPAYVRGVRAASNSLSRLGGVPSRCAIDTWIQCYPETSEEELRRDFVCFCEGRAYADQILSEVRAVRGGQMNKERRDLQAIVAYLRSVAAVKNVVPPPVPTAPPAAPAAR